MAGSNGVSVLLGNQNSTFGSAVTWITTAGSWCNVADGGETCGPPTTIAIGDFNGDGKSDLAVNDGTVGGIFVLLGNGDGSFQTPPIHSANAAGLGGYFNVLASADFSGNGNLDLAMGVSWSPTQPSPDLFYYAGQGNGSFPFPLELNVGTGGAYSHADQQGTPLAVADLNGDGAPDVILGTFPAQEIGSGQQMVVTTKQIL